MATTWIVCDSSGQMLTRFIGSSRLEVERKVVPTYFDAFRLQVSPSYRESFERALRRVLQREGWHIVRLKSPRP